MDTMRCAMLLKKRGIRLDKEIGKYLIVDILDFISEEAQNKLVNSTLNQLAIEELFKDSMKNTNIKNVNNEIMRRLNDSHYIEGLIQLV